MTGCLGSGTLQDHLEGLLAEAQRPAVERHLAECPRCAAESARLGSLFLRLGALTLESPSPWLAERVLDRVLPSRQRVRWLRRLGIGYAASLATSLVGLGVWVTQPSARAFMAWVTAEASARIFHSLMFVVNSVSFLALNLAGGWDVLSALRSRISPLTRAVLAVADKGLIQAAVVVSVLLCLGIVWSLRSRPGRGKGMHVGVLGF